MIERYQKATPTPLRSILLPVMTLNIGDEFQPLMVAGGAAAASNGISEENILMANARIDELGGNSSMIMDINNKKGNSGKSIWDIGFTGAGFHSSPSLSEMDKDYVKNVPRCFKEGLTGGETKCARNGGFGGGGMQGLGGGGGYTGGNGGAGNAGAGGGGSFNSDPDGTNAIVNLGPGECTMRLVMATYTL